MRRSEQRTGISREQRGRSLVDLERSLGEEKMCAVSKLQDSVRARLQLRHGFHEKRPFGIVQAESFRDNRRELLVIGLADIMAVEVLKLLEVKAGRRLADMVEVEPLGRLLAADDLVVAMAPAEAQEVVGDRLGQKAQLVAVSVDSERAVALAELGPV